MQALQKTAASALPSSVSETTAQEYEGLENLEASEPSSPASSASSTSASTESQGASAVPEIVGLMPDPSEPPSTPSPATTSSTKLENSDNVPTDLRIPQPRDPKEPSISLTIVASKTSVSKFAVERRHAMNRLKSAWEHVIVNSPQCPISTQHCYFLHVTDGAVYDAIPFSTLCEEAERAITSFARAIVAREKGIRKRGGGGGGGGGGKRGGSGGRGGGSRGGEGVGNAEKKRDLAKKKQIWKGTGVH